MENNENKDRPKSLNIAVRQIGSAFIFTLLAFLSSMIGNYIALGFSIVCVWSSIQYMHWKYSEKENKGWEGFLWGVQLWTGFFTMFTLLSQSVMHVWLVVLGGIIR